MAELICDAADLLGVGLAKCSDGSLAVGLGPGCEILLPPQLLLRDACGCLSLCETSAETILNVESLAIRGLALLARLPERRLDLSVALSQGPGMLRARAAQLAGVCLAEVGHGRLGVALELRHQLALPSKLFPGRFEVLVALDKAALPCLLRHNTLTVGLLQLPLALPTQALDVRLTLGQGFGMFPGCLAQLRSVGLTKLADGHLAVGPCLRRELALVAYVLVGNL
mmetsp:Transcript_18379/g.39131  ORF Transcript_18379/g.39131 Transcript_18379/m.39131 type:complete len:226 (+) Transcript_18379:136-813(+)